MPIDQLLVIADAHLRADSGADEDAFLALLASAPARADALLLAGDIYDFWFAYRYLVPRHCIRTTARIVDLAARMPVYMLGGNHDRWGDTFWTPETGVHFDRRSLTLHVGTRNVLALHGDGLHEERSVAATLNRILDAPMAHRVFDLLPPAAGFAIARRLAHKPDFAAAHPGVVETATARQLAWATARLTEDRSIDTLILAHTHRAALAEILPGRWYLNPGPWLVERRYAIVTGDGIELLTFD